ncbi:MAG: hypothetical protein WC773_01900 [Patescibacteria group bacterium]|jgi:hypothetical protein
MLVAWWWIVGAMVVLVFVLAQGVVRLRRKVRVVLCVATIALAVTGSVVMTWVTKTVFEEVWMYIVLLIAAFVAVHLTLFVRSDETEG